jgi:hypothetical protein
LGFITPWWRFADAAADDEALTSASAPAPAPAPAPAVEVDSSLSASATVGAAAHPQSLRKSLNPASSRGEVHCGGGLSAESPRGRLSHVVVAQVGIERHVLETRIDVQGYGFVKPLAFRRWVNRVQRATSPPHAARAPAHFAVWLARRLPGGGGGGGGGRDGADFIGVVNNRNMNGWRAAALLRVHGRRRHPEDEKGHCRETRAKPPHLQTPPTLRARALRSGRVDTTFFFGNRADAVGS